MENKKNNEIDIRQLVRIAWDHKWWFVISVVLLLLLGQLYCMRNYFEFFKLKV